MTILLLYSMACIYLACISLILCRNRFCAVVPVKAIVKPDAIDCIDPPKDWEMIFSLMANNSTPQQRLDALRLHSETLELELERRSIPFGGMAAMQGNARDRRLMMAPLKSSQSKFMGVKTATIHQEYKTVKHFTKIFESEIAWRA